MTIVTYNTTNVYRNIVFQKRIKRIKPALDVLIHKKCKSEPISQFIDAKCSGSVQPILDQLTFVRTKPPSPV